MSHGRILAFSLLAIALLSCASLGPAQVAIDGRSVLLRPAGAHGWRLRCDAAAMRLERGAVFDEGAARATQVLVLPGVVRPGAAIRVRWKLSRDDG